MKLRSIFTILIMMCLPFVTMAQAETEPAATETSSDPVLSSSPEAQGAPIIPDVPTPVPIDGGLSLLLVAGIGYGVKKYKERRNDKY